MSRCSVRIALEIIMIDEYKLGRIDYEALKRPVRVDAEHPDFTKMKAKWKVVRDAETFAYEEYVIPPEYDRARIKSTRIAARNANYVARAVFTNFVTGTMSAWAGIATSKPAEIEVPSQMEYLKTDATEDRLSLSQLDRKCIRELGGYGRFVMFTDFPSVEPGLTAEQVANIDPKPRIRYYKSEDFINWDVGYFNGAYQLSFAVLRETVRTRVDGFTWAHAYQYRVVELDADGDMMITIRDKDGELVAEPIWPKFDNDYIHYIVLDVVGTEDNNTEVDEPPAFPIAHVNFGHLRNNASYEDNLDAHSQGTLFITSSLTPSQWSEMVAKRPVVMGSREGYYLGNQGSASLLQLEANQESDNAMKRKEEQMFAMGAHMITTATVNAPVATTHMNMGSKVAPIVNWVKNYNAALYQQFLNCARYLKAPENEIKLAYPTDFIPKAADAGVLAQLLAQQMGGVVSKSVLRAYNRQIGVIPETMTDDNIEEEISNENPLGVPFLPTLDTNPITKLPGTQPVDEGVVNV